MRWRDRPGHSPTSELRLPPRGWADICLVATLASARCHRLGCGVAAVLAMAVGSPAASEQVFLCRMADGHAVYTDMGCRDGDAKDLDIEPVAVVTRPSSTDLSDAERRALERSERWHAERRAASETARRQRARRAREAVAAQERRCAESQADLVRLRERMKQGYLVRDARELWDQVRRLEATRRASC